MAAEAFDAEPPRFVRPGEDERAEQRAGALLPYFRVRCTFDARRARELLGAEPPALEDYFPSLMRYARESQWGKQPSPRWDAGMAQRAPHRSPGKVAYCDRMAAPQPLSDLASRARAWRDGAHARICDVLEPWEHGTVRRAARYPGYYDYNAVRVDGDPQMSIEELIGVADRSSRASPTGAWTSTT